MPTLTKRHLFLFSPPTLATGVLLASMLLAGCAGSGVASPGSGAVDLDRSHSSSGNARPDEPLTITATGADGAKYVLTVPEGAVIENVTIQMTPIKGVSTIPGTIAGGVQLLPEGLVFLRPASLKVSLPAGKSLADSFAFSFDGGAEEPYLTPGDSATGEIMVSHFSGFGFVRLTTTDLQNWPTIRNAARLATHQLAQPQTTERKIQIYKDWWDLYVRPPLAEGGQGLITGLKGYMMWSTMLYPPATTEPAVIAGLSTELADSEAVLATSLKDGIAYENGVGAALQSVTHAKQVVFYWSIANLRNVATSENHLDLETVKRELCVQPDIDVVFPDSMDRSDTAELTVKGGLKFGDHDREASPLVLTIKSVGANEPDLTKNLAAGEILTRSHTVATSASYIEVEVKASYRLLPTFTVERTVLKRATVGGGSGPAIPIGSYEGEVGFLVNLWTGKKTSTRMVLNSGDMWTTILVWSDKYETLVDIESATITGDTNGFVAVGRPVYGWGYLGSSMKFTGSYANGVLRISTMAFYNNSGNELNTVVGIGQGNLTKVVP